MVRFALAVLSIVSLATAATAQEPQPLPTPGEPPVAAESPAAPESPAASEPTATPESPAASEPTAVTVSPAALESSASPEQPAEPERVVPVDLSLVPPISLNGERPAHNYLSLGLGAARSGSLEGVAIAPVHWTDGAMDGLQVGWAAATAGGVARGVQAGAVTVAPELLGLQASYLVALTQGDVAGVQASGITAIAKGSVAGVQASSIFNWAERVEGLQASSIATVATGHIEGVQASGVYNQAERIDGLQASGIAAVAKGPIKGVQASGVYSQADRVDGLQASAVNYTSAITGLQVAVINIGWGVQGGQVGLVNIADEVDGAQVGLFNYAKSADASVGLFSWVPNGTSDIEFFATEFSPINAAVRLGGDRVYGLLVAGVQPSERESVDEVRWTFGAGVGTRIDLSDRFRLDADLLAQNVQYGAPYDTDDGENVLTTLRALVGFQATPWLAAFAGPTLSVYSAKEENPDIDFGTDFDLWGDSRAWVGLAGGLRF